MGHYSWNGKPFRVKSVWWRLKRRAMEMPWWYIVGSVTRQVADDAYRLDTKVYLCHSRECAPPNNAKARRWQARFAKRYHRKMFTRCFVDYKQRGLTLTRGRVILTPSQALI